jgi:hypothetical protein
LIAWLSVTRSWTSCSSSTSSPSLLRICSKNFGSISVELDANRDRAPVEGRPSPCYRGPEDGADLRVERRGQALDPDGIGSGCFPAAEARRQVLAVQDQLDRERPVPV